MKIVKAVAPYIYPNGINFKHKPYDAWKGLGGRVARAHYPIRAMHRLAFRYELPSLYRNKSEARLRFVQPWSLEFDTFPDYALYEIIPFFWDVWPENFEKTFAWLKKHYIRTAIFTSSQVAEMVKKLFPEMNVLAVTEGIDVESYSRGKQLKDREIDFLEYGRNIDRVVKYRFEGLNVIRGQRDGKNLLTQEQLLGALQNAKAVAAFTKKWTNPDQAGDIDTLTQRYWECMLSGCIMIGHAPNELVKLLGYNPVVELDRRHPNEQLRAIIANIKDYQPLVDKNRKEAIMKADWSMRMKDIMQALIIFGYEI